VFLARRTHRYPGGKKKRKVRKKQRWRGKQDRLKVPEKGGNGTMGAKVREKE
jgi:hypothetical protein